MFFTFAEKQKTGIVSRWSLRQIAFDARRRHLYVSETVTEPEEVAEPNGYAEPMAVGSACSRTSRYASVDSLRLSPARSTGLSPTSRRTAQPPSPHASPLSSAVYDPEVDDRPATVSIKAVWKNKINVDLIEVVAVEKRLPQEEGAEGEKMLFQIHLYGESRKLQSGERPPAGALLCPAAGLGAAPNRYTCGNAKFIRDPFLLQELFEGLHAVAVDLRLQRDSANAQERARTGRIIDLPKRLTLPSPGSSRGTSFVRKRITLRLRNEYEFRRFWFVVQTSCGFDKLCMRPYRGLPPYDPRNGCSFAQIPMSIWHAFRELDRSIMYTFMRGDLTCRSTTTGELSVYPKGGYLVFSHECVYVLRESCTVARWARLRNIHTFEYNTDCSLPYVAFLTDVAESDLIFVLKPPVYGEEAIRRYNPRADALHILEVVRDLFYGSVDVRRAINIKAAEEHTVRLFVERVERESGQQLDFDPTVLLLGSEAQCGLPLERPPQAWEALRTAYTQADFNRMHQTAIPLYDGHPNSDAFEADVLLEMERHMSRDRVSQYDVVGMNSNAQQQMRDAILTGQLDSATSSDYDDRLNDGEEREDPYYVAGSKYLTKDEAVALGEPSTPGLRLVTTPKVTGKPHTQASVFQPTGKFSDPLGGDTKKQATRVGGCGEVRPTGSARAPSKPNALDCKASSESASPDSAAIGIGRV